MKTFINGHEVKDVYISGNKVETLWQDGVKIYEVPIQEKAFYFNGASNSFAELTNNSLWDINIGDEIEVIFDTISTNARVLFNKSSSGSTANRMIAFTNGIYLKANNVVIDFRGSNSVTTNQWHTYNIKVIQNGSNVDIVHTFNGNSVLITKTAFAFLVNNNPFRFGGTYDFGLNFIGRVKFIRKNNDILTAQDAPLGAITSKTTSLGNTFTFNNVTVVNI